jgi:hypothetical protein
VSWIWFRNGAFWTLGIGLLAVSTWPLAFGRWPLAISCWLLAFGTWLVFYRLLLILKIKTNQSQWPTANSQSLKANSHPPYNSRFLSHF